MVSPDLFPGDIPHFFSADRYDGSVLSAGEMAIAGAYGAKRFADFCTGRYCMRQATAPLGFAGEILIGERGMPLLPADITASLSHSKNICGAIAGPKDKYLSLGIDIETCGRVKKDMWYLLFTNNEQRYLQSLGEEGAVYTSTVFFSLKEAFYKLQFPLTETFLDFPDVEVVAADDSYAIKPLKHVNEIVTEGRLFPGHVIAHEDEVITYFTLPVERS